MPVVRLTVIAVGLLFLVSAMPSGGPVAAGGGNPWLGPASVRAASPAPSADTTGDTRSAGEGPGLVGAPLLAIGGAIGLGLLAALATIVYVRLTGGGSAPSTQSATGAPAGAGTAEPRS